MPQTSETMLAWLRKVLGFDANYPKLPLEKYLCRHSPHGMPGKTAQRDGRADPRRCRCQARRNGRRGRYPPAFDERHAPILPR